MNSRQISKIQTGAIIPEHRLRCTMLFSRFFAFCLCGIALTAGTMFILEWHGSVGRKSCTKCSHRSSSNAYFDAAVNSFTQKHPSLPMILSGDVGGGLGNQIEHILGHLASSQQSKAPLDFGELVQLILLHTLNEFRLSLLVQRKGEREMQKVMNQPNLSVRRNFHLVWPRIIPRGNPNLRVRADSVWDFDALQDVLSSRLFVELPDQCNSSMGGHVDVRIDHRRGILAKRHSGIHVIPESLAEKTIRVEIDRNGLSNVSDVREFIMDLLSHRSVGVINNLSRTVICVDADYFTSKAAWKFAPYLVHVQSIVQAAKSWPLEILGVVHLRWDEHRCIPGPTQVENPYAYVCVLRMRRSRSEAIVQWVSIAKYTSAIARVMRLNGVSEVYMAKSSYVPETTWDLIRIALGKGENLTLARRAEHDYKDDVLNYVERELARRCRYFIGDYGSSWSFSVVKMRESLPHTFATYLFTFVAK
jgi:hypothetical protein